VITSEEKQYILSQAYVPEHAVDLITRLSGGEPFLNDDYLCCLKGHWLIIVGYPLAGNFKLRSLEDFYERITKKFSPRTVSLIAPELPTKLSVQSHEKESDSYYTLDIQGLTIKSGLKRVVKKAQSQLNIQCGDRMQKDHHELAQEFIERVKPGPRVKKLLLKMPEYVGNTEHSILLDAWNNDKKLVAYYIVDLAVKKFSTYVIGCHSKINYVPGASDLLCYEMIRISRDRGKSFIHLGLGVNEGIRRFKKKWGGRPTLKYEMCELVLKKPSLLETILALR
jgi:hypothetical protein